MRFGFSVVVGWLVVTGCSPAPDIVEGAPTPDAGAFDGGRDVVDGGNPDPDPGDGGESAVEDGGGASDGGDFGGTTPYAIDPSLPFCLGGECFERWSALHLVAVWVAPDGGVWLVTSDGYVFRYHDSALEHVPMPDAARPTAVDGFASDNVWFPAGFGTVLHWNGAAVDTFELDPAVRYVRVHVRGVDDVWVQGLEPSLIQATYAHYTDGIWTTVHEGAPRTKTFHVLDDGQIWGVDDWAVHYDGVSWQTMTPEGLVPGLGFAWVDRSWAFTDTNVWLGGGASAQVALLLHWDGAAWSRVGDDLPILQLLSLWGSPTGTVWGVDIGDTVVRITADGTTTLLPAGLPPYDPSDPVPPGAANATVAGTSDDNVWIATSQGRLQHWNGSTWEAVLPPPVVDAGP